MDGKLYHIVLYGCNHSPMPFNLVKGKVKTAPLDQNRTRCPRYVIFISRISFVSYSSIIHHVASRVYHGHRNYKFIRRTRTGIIQIEMPYGDSPVTHRNQTQVMVTSSSGNIFRVTGPLCGEFTGPGEFPAQRPVTQSFDAFFDLRPNKRLSKQPWGWWFETQSWSLWRHCNVKQCCLWLPGELVDGKSAAV